MDDTGGNLIIVSGMSGAGRSSVADVLEDLGWFVVDNLPPMFLTTLVEQVIGTGAAPRLAVVVDVRTGLFFEELSSAIHDLRLKGYRPLTLFLGTFSCYALLPHFSSMSPRIACASLHSAAARLP